MGALKIEHKLVPTPQQGTRNAFAQKIKASTLKAPITEVLEDEIECPSTPGKRFSFRRVCKNNSWTPQDYLNENQVPPSLIALQKEKEKGMEDKKCLTPMLNCCGEAEVPQEQN